MKDESIFVVFEIERLLVHVSECEYQKNVHRWLWGGGSGMIQIIGMQCRKE